MRRLPVPTVQLAAGTGGRCIAALRICMRLLLCQLFTFTPLFIQGEKWYNVSITMITGRLSRGNWGRNRHGK